jgi:hypothetical protein
MQQLLLHAAFYHLMFGMPQTPSETTTEVTTARV